MINSFFDNANVLIVDDDQYNLIILGEILKRNGCTIRPVSDGIAALRASEELKPDIILLDVMMPGMDGYEVCQRLKENPNLCDIPVIFISSLQGSKDVVKALRVGGVDYITKPFEAEEIVSRVNTHLKLYQQNKQLIELNAHLTESQEQFTQFASHLIIAREEERAQLSKEIHDKIAQVLIALKIDMGLWRDKISFLSENPKPNEVLGKFKELMNTVDTAIKSVRKVLGKLKSDELELLGFIETAKLCSIEFECINKINCKVETSLSKLELNELQKVALYRILQEALSNILQHANATSVVISFYIQNESFVMEIVDNGIGLDKTKNTLKDAFGLIDMNQRVEMLQGKLTITDNIDKGTCVKVEMPYPAK